jgi:hypothetical protein
VATGATGTFVITEWAEDVYDDGDGATLTRVSAQKAFAGDLVGTSSTELLTVQSATGGCAYVGLERVQGSLDGRSGSFVLHHDTVSWVDASVAVAAIVPGSGTAELVGLEGRMTITRHEDDSWTWTLGYRS